MQEDRDHKGLLDRMRSFIIEDAPAGEEQELPNAAEGDPAGKPPVRKQNDDVDRMFADIESQVSTKSGGTLPAAAQAPAAGGAPLSSSAAVGSVLTPDVQKVVKLIDALPAVLTKEQVQPLLVATMDAASLDAKVVSAHIEDGKRQAAEGIAGAQQEIVRLENDREDTIARLEKLMEAARAQCTQGVAAQQARAGELTAAMNTLARVSEYLPGAPAQNAAEKRS